MSHEITQLLEKWSGGDRDALERLIPLVYAELHKLAEGQMRREFSERTLQATALVNELYLRLTDWANVDWRNRAHFFGVAAKLMRNILVDHARERQAQKRGGDLHQVTLSSALDWAGPRDVDTLHLDDVLTRLEAMDPVQGRIVELRFFGGLTLDETAEVMGISPSTVTREWRMARAWLSKALAQG